MSEIATTGETVYAGPVKDIAEFIQACSFLSDSTGSHILLEMLPQRIVGKDDRQNLLFFAEYPCKLPHLISDYTAGRIFHEEFELRWEKFDSGTQVVYIGKQRALPRLTDDIDILTENTSLLKDCAKITSSYYLFGKRLNDTARKNIGPPAQKGDFAEVRIPRLLRYPVKEQDKEYVKLSIYEYRHKATNERILFRFRKLDEVKE